MYETLSFAFVIFTIFYFKYHGTGKKSFLDPKEIKNKIEFLSFFFISIARVSIFILN